MTRHDPLAHPERLIRSVYAYVAYRVGPGPDAEADITSETFESCVPFDTAIATTRTAESRLPG